jgi:hypothetical protein
MMKNLLAAITTILLLTSCAGKQAAIPTASMMYKDHVITSDTVWHGDVIIEGVVLVARKATLTIKPGTTVRFRRIDRNNDNIGDSELRVLGRVVAAGLPAFPIVFESAEQNPQPKDWSYLLIFASGKKSSLSYCEFRHAFSGVQVHFSTATISNSLFEKNNEGIRFGRARLSIAKNLIRNNDVGIRFTRMEGPVVIKHNEIRDNRLGIFLVPSGQNIQDFFEPDRSGKPWNTGRLLITENNIHNNTMYNLSLGEKQLWDLDITRNWWGSQNKELIERGIFDKNSDPELGKALIMPYADRPFGNAGIDH